MMQFIRERANGPVVKFLFLGILISFLGFGSVSIFSGSADKAATVNGVEISVQTIRQEYENLLRRQDMAQLTDQEREELKKIAIQSVFEESAVDQMLDKSGITATDEEVLRALMADPTFHVDGKFSSDQYNSILKQMHINRAAFENNVRLSLAKQKLLRSITDTAYVAPKSIENVARILNEKRDIKQATIYYNKLTDKAEVTDEEIAQEYNENLARYMTDELYKISYLEIKDELDTITVTDEDLDAAIADRQEKASRTVDQIIIEPNNDGEKEAALAKLNEVYEALNANEVSFEEAAKDLETNYKAFYLKNNRYTRGISESKVFDDVLYSLKLAAPISKPFEAENALHLIKLTQIDKAYDSLETLKEEIKVEKAQQRYFTQISKLQELSDLYTDSLNEIAMEMGLEVKTTGWESLNNLNSILNNEKVNEAFLNPDVIEYHKNSLPFSLEDRHAMILRIADHQPSRQKTLEEARDEISEKLEAKKNEALVLKEIDDIKAELEDPKADFETIVKRKGFDYAAYKDIKQDDIPALALRPVEMLGMLAAFQTEGNLEEGKSILNVNVQPIGISLSQISNVVPGALDDFTKEEQDQIKMDLQIEQVGAEYRALIESLMHQSEIKIYRENVLN